ncbi:ankyrin repeat-containing domain protein [Daldinia caldariorum]|uniref:ankyrin repeat-containing domain protein n=1 Tax=Daldinia caldariorum TaxID=326644 RepID=UPI002007C4F5|nr:ankyrin repeat-containing domain protein [Daldinia caldariorum]KAI1466931.1 ankyrin repeat-containing domain protein [Daldinia caldariorum]
MANLIRLPEELLLEITTCDVLGPIDLASLALVNKRLFRVANESLYKTFGQREAIISAVMNGNINTLEVALYYGLDIHYDKYRAVCMASRHRQIEVMKWLLNHGAPVDHDLIGTFASISNSPLFFALHRRDEEAVLFLLGLGAIPRFINLDLHNNINGNSDDDDSIPTVADETALHIASGLNMLQVMEVLVRENIIPIDEATSTNPPALHMLNRHYYDIDFIPAFHKLIELGADINSTPSSNLIPLTLAITLRQFAYAEALLDAGADVTPKHKLPRIYHPIHACFWNPRIKGILDTEPLEIHDPPMYALLTRLLKLGADLHESYPGGHTPLGCAVYYKTPPYVSYLLSIGSRVNEIDAAAYTPLDLFVRRADTNPIVFLRMLQTLLRGGARMDTPLRSGLTLLEWIIEQNDRSISTAYPDLLREVLKMATPAMLDQEYLDKLLAKYFDTDHYEMCLVLMKYGATLRDYDEAFTSARRFILCHSEQAPRDSEVHSRYMQMITRANLPEKSIADLIAYARLAGDEESIRILQSDEEVWPSSGLSMNMALALLSVEENGMSYTDRLREAL